MIDQDWIKPHNLADKNTALGDADWFHSQIDDRQEFSTMTLVEGLNAIVGRNTIETGESRAFSLLPE